jgi:dihydrofolate synthase/folylpolyglutamate synthase
VQKLAKQRPLVIVFGAMKDKDLTAMLGQLRAVDAPVIFTAIDWHRAAAPTDLAGQFGAPAETADSSGEALDRARERASSNGIVLVCGSLYLVGEVMARYRDRGTRKATRVAKEEASLGG